MKTIYFVTLVTESRINDPIVFLSEELYSANLYVQAMAKLDNNEECVYQLFSTTGVTVSLLHTFEIRNHRLEVLL